MVSFYIVLAIIAAIIIHTVQITNRAALPTQQRAREINARLYRYLNYRTDKTIAINLTGYKISKTDQAAALDPEPEFEKMIVNIYRNRKYYQKINRYARGFKLLWWTFRPTEAEIWKYRERNVGRNQIAEDRELMYAAYLHQNIWYTDSQGIEKIRQISDYNQHRLKQLLPAAIWEQLERQKLGQEGITETWDYIEHTNKPEPLPTLEDLPEYEPEFEIGNDYLAEREKTYSLPANETNTIELQPKISPYRPRYAAEQETNPKPAPLLEIPVLEIDLL